MHTLKALHKRKRTLAEFMQELVIEPLNMPLLEDVSAPIRKSNRILQQLLPPVKRRKLSVKPKIRCTNCERESYHWKYHNCCARCYYRMNPTKDMRLKSKKRRKYSKSARHRHGHSKTKKKDPLRKKNCFVFTVEMFN
jgi:hypothetical protein